MNHRFAYALACLGLLPTCSWAQTPVSRTIDAAEFVRTAEKALECKSASLTGNMEWSLVGRLDAFQLAADRYELVAGEVRGQWPRRRVGVPVNVLVDGKKMQSRIVWFSVRQWTPALVYRQAATSGDVVDPEQIGVERMDVVGLDVPDPRQTDWVRGMRLRHPVRAGQLVLRTDFEPAPAVARNDEVQLAVQVGTIRLVTSAVAFEDGAIDELINVRPEGVTDMVRARVVGRNEVQIER